MNKEVNLLKTAGEDVARAAYQSDGSFGTSPPQWGIASIILDQRYQTLFIVTGLLMWGFAYDQLTSQYTNITFSRISYLLIVMGALLIVRSAVRIASIWKDKTIRFRQVTVFFDRMVLLPEGLVIKYNDVDFITHEVSLSYSLTTTHLQGDIHIFTVFVKGCAYRCRWYGPSPNAVFDDYNLNKLLQYLGFCQIDKTKFQYDIALAPGPPVGFIPVKLTLINKNMSLATVIVSLAVVGVVIYFVWIHVAVKIMQ